MTTIGACVFQCVGFGWRTFLFLGEKLMEVYKLYKTDQERREREKQELMELSEKELLAEMILEMRSLNRTAKRIQLCLMLDDNKNE